MTTKTRRWPLAHAEQVALELVAVLEDTCDRIEVAGSIRRRKSDVGDIEILAISKVTDAYGLSENPGWPGAPANAPTPRGLAMQLDMLSQKPPPEHRYLDDALLQLIEEGVLKYRYNSAGHRIGFGEMNKHLVDVSSGIAVDIFSATAKNWGMALVVRTGPADFNIRMMARFQALGMRGHAYGGVTVNEAEVECPTESAVFDLLGWSWVRPEDRL